MVLLNFYSKGVSTLFSIWLQNLEVKETIKKTKKNKEEIKKELKDSLINTERNENKGYQREI